MIVLCYGITKSGSTLAFELCKAALEARGFRQRRLPDTRVAARHLHNFMAHATLPRLMSLLDAVAPYERIAIKLHGDLPPESRTYLNSAAGQSAFRVQLSYRDPREICLSLLDAGRQSRERAPSAELGFGAVIHSLEDAARFTSEQLLHCRHWASVRGALPLYYNDLAFTGEAAIERLCAHLEIAPFDPESRAVLKRQVFESTPTLKNRGIIDRHRELTASEDAFLRQRITDSEAFIEHACRRRDYAWLASPLH